MRLTALKGAMFPDSEADFGRTPFHLQLAAATKAIGAMAQYRLPTA